MYYRGAFGGVISYEYMKKHSPLTLVLIGVNAAIFLIAMILRIHNEIITIGGMVPLEYILVYKEYWRFLTSMFIHGDLMHLVFNMIILLHAGAYLEQFLKSKKFISLYLLTGLLVALFTGIFSSGITVGASGAIFSLLGYILYYELENRKKGINSYSVIVPLVAINVIFTFLDPRISIVGHLSGLIIGYLVALFQNKRKINFRG
ncbi:rhomboid protease GluP [Desulfonispora thiosulfatigenes DSM 11270]|uniref:Rhomboid protease GluP n=1 Tax=Desulfonispora thiosulfatigenes DSM 11270 TaxID=656914 RepID=A0A1W1VB68_DESTI|nr:rhomboid family intramembrane serine protease [Desulfonispora thiosulfatigenes]SMB90602.1 rhomboid protease GluP [Desulfonispora thiosulfatigenes DSM 11270]